MDWTASQFASGEFALSRKKPPAQTGRMTLKKLTALVSAGYGQGHFHRYKPWLRVTKRDYSPNSFIGHLPAISLARQHHFRSIAERITIQASKWLGAVDVREAYPVWPWEHPHPGHGLPGFERAANQPGLLEIAKESGIAHGVFAGTALPYVATLDELTTWRDDRGNYFLVAFQNKPRDIVHEATLMSRAKERLELGARYCNQAGIPHRIIHAENLPQELVTNLDLLEPQMTEQQQESLRKSKIYTEIVDKLNAHGTETAPIALLEAIEQRQKVSTSMSTAAFHLALWRQDIDHDLSKPLRPWEPLTPGGRAIKKTLFEAWVEGKA